MPFTALLAFGARTPQPAISSLRLRPDLILGVAVLILGVAVLKQCSNPPDEEPEVSCGDARSQPKASQGTIVS